MTFDVHEVTDSDNNLLDLLSQLTSRREDQSLASLDVGVEFLQYRNGECCSLSRTRLRLCNDVGAYILGKNT